MQSRTPALGRDADADEPEIIAERLHGFQRWADFTAILSRRGVVASTPTARNMLPQAWAILDSRCRESRRSLIRICACLQPMKECGVRLRCELVKNGTLEFDDGVDRGSDQFIRACRRTTCGVYSQEWRHPSPPGRGSSPAADRSRCNGGRCGWRLQADARCRSLSLPPIACAKARSSQIEDTATPQNLEFVHFCNALG